MHLSVRPCVGLFQHLLFAREGRTYSSPPPPPHPTANRNGGGGGGRRGGGKGRSKRRYPGQNPKGITVIVKGLYTRRLTVYHTSKTPSLHHHHVETPARSRTTMTHTHTHTHTQRNSLRLVPVFRLHSARELDKRHKGAVNVLHRVARAEKQTHNKKRRSIRRAATRRDDNPHHENQAHSGTVGTWQLQVFTTRRRREMALARV